MVNILISEDDPRKLTEISAYVTDLGVSPDSIISATNMVEFTSKYSAEIDICVIDIRMPAYNGGPQDQNGIGVLQHIESVSNGDVRLIAISSYPEEFDDLRPKFEKQGCILVDFESVDIWQSILRSYIFGASAQQQFDFLIFTALQKERAPYLAKINNGASVTAGELSRFDFTLDGKKGAIVLLPRMGLVDASIIAAKCIDRYKPKLVAMSGICAGFKGRAELGQLLVSELSYEYQTGKWSKDGFESEPYQNSISEPLRVLLSSMIEERDLLHQLETGWSSSRPAAAPTPKLAVFTSGSAVIANKDYIDQVSSFHRKVSGLDMEVFGIHRAAHLSGVSPDVICAKVVVDLADEKKDDSLQEYGCYVSSEFVLRAISRYFLDR